MRVGSRDGGRSGRAALYGLRGTLWCATRSAGVQLETIPVDSIAQPICLGVMSAPLIKKHTPVLLHRAPLGRRRFVAVLIELRRQLPYG